MKITYAFPAIKLSCVDVGHLEVEGLELSMCRLEFEREISRTKQLCAMATLALADEEDCARRRSSASNTLMPPPPLASRAPWEQQPLLTPSPSESTDRLTVHYLLTPFGKAPFLPSLPPLSCPS